MNLRDKITQAKLSIEPVQAFDTTVYVREMGAGEVASFHRWHTQQDNPTGMDVMLAVAIRTLCDEQGERLFGDGDGDELANVPARDIRAVYEVASKLNQITDDDVEAAEGN